MKSTFSVLFLLSVFVPQAIADNSHTKVKNVFFDYVYSQEECQAIGKSAAERLTAFENAQKTSPHVFHLEAEYSYYCHKACHHVCDVRVTLPQNYRVSVKNGKRVSGSERLVTCQNQKISLDSDPRVLWSGVLDDFFPFIHHCWVSALVLTQK